MTGWICRPCQRDQHGDHCDLEVNGTYCICQEGTCS